MSLRERTRRVTAHPSFRWAERAVWVAVAVFVLHRLGPQLSALTGIGPTLGSAPTFAATTLDDRTFTTDDLKGRVVVVNFWATWCYPCRIEMPAFQALTERYGEDELVVLAIATDRGGRAAVEPYLRQAGYTFPVALATPALRRAFGGIDALPTTFVIDREGIVRNRVLGLFAPPAMNAAVERLLDEPRAGEEPARPGG
jgi:thiol-disulfide isomerase/thioredoxin